MDELVNMYAPTGLKKQNWKKLINFNIEELNFEREANK